MVRAVMPRVAATNDRCRRVSFSLIEKSSLKASRGAGMTPCGTKFFKRGIRETPFAPFYPFAPPRQRGRRERTRLFGLCLLRSSLFDIVSDPARDRHHLALGIVPVIEAVMLLGAEMVRRGPF